MGILRIPHSRQDPEGGGGVLVLSTGPGLEIELDDDEMEKMIDHGWRHPETCQVDDGAVVDW